MNNEATEFQELIKSLAEMPKDAPKAYVYLWQLETWLRQMVYVELKSDMGENWTDGIRFETADKAEIAISCSSTCPDQRGMLLAL